MSVATPVVPAAIEIGRSLRDARRSLGYTRNAFAETKKLKGRITPEGIRKIEEGERVPRLENLRLIAEAAHLPNKRIKELEEKAVAVNVRRVVRRSGNATVDVRINGQALRVTALPPARKAEEFARTTIGALLPVLEKLGMDNPLDVEYFRQHARAKILESLGA